MTYADVDRDDEPNVELAQELLSKCRPLVEGSAQWRYLTETRGITPDAVRYCMADLRALEPQIKGFDRLARGVVSLLRDGTGEITGLAVEACGIAGERIRDANGQTMRRSYALKKRGQIDALFRVDPTGSNAMICYACEGRLAKPLAVAAVMGDPAIVGWGGLHGLGRCLPPEMTVVVVEDARPADDVKADLHDQAMARGSDRLIASGRIVLRAGGPRCACCKDLDEALGKHPVEELRAWLTSGKRAELSLDGEARRCAKIKDPIKRAEAVAEVIKDRALRKTPGMIPAFRKEVDKYAGGHADDDDEDGVELQGEAVTFEDILPWPEAVDGAQLVADIEAFIVARAIVPKHGPLTCALWVLHAHSYEAAYHSPRLTLRSPTKGCGKSTLRRALSRLVPRAYEAVDITGPTFFRPISQWHPTVFVDEGNEINWAEARDLVSVVNSGHCRDDPGVPRCVGPDFEVRMFPVWAPLCLALIGFLPSAITERSITIEMRKKLRADVVQRTPRRDRDAAAHALARRAARWAVDHMLALESADPVLPPALGDRPADNWRPLLAIADLIGLGGEARKTAIALSLTDDDAEDISIQLLADIHEVFEALGKTHLSSAVIVGQLTQMEDRPWAEYGKARMPISKNGMARLLKPFKIRPTGTIRVGDKTPKGYARAAFEDAWKQYSIPFLSSVPPQQPPKRHNPSEPWVSDDSHPQHDGAGVADVMGLKATETAACGGLADETPLRDYNSYGNGTDADAEADRVIAEIASGDRCGGCAILFDGEDAEQVGERWYHRTPECAGAARAKAPPPPKPKRKRRIKGADTTPDVKEMPE